MQRLSPVSGARARNDVAEAMSTTDGHTNQGWTYTEQVSDGDHGVELVAWLARRHAHSDATTWAARIAEGQVSVGPDVITTSTVLRRGQNVAWCRPPWTEPEVPRHFGLLHVDDDLLVVTKPSGLPTVPAGGFLHQTLLTVVRETWPEATPMHRLGRGTSGLVLFARTEASRKQIQGLWRDHNVEKHYLGVVAGAPPWDTRSLDSPIGLVPHPRLGEVWAASSSGRPSRTDATVIERDTESLVRLRLWTGRPHQIRIHLAAAGFPLAGDPLYGIGGTPRSEALPGDIGYRLHAESLGFVHPTTGQRLHLSAPAPWAGNG